MAGACYEAPTPPDDDDAACLQNIDVNKRLLCHLVLAYVLPLLLIYLFLTISVRTIISTSTGPIFVRSGLRTYRNATSIVATFCQLSNKIGRLV